VPGSVQLASIRIIELSAQIVSHRSGIPPASSSAFKAAANSVEIAVATLLMKPGFVAVCSPAG
jgi:hypothetical protein